MTAATSIKSSTVKKVFSLGIAVYAVVWLGVFIFASHVFGMGSGIGLSLVLAFPFLVAVRMRLQWSKVRDREFVLLLVLLAFAFGGGVYTIWYWYDVGVDVEHASDVRFAELTRIAHADPAFRDIQFSITNYKGRYVVTGYVLSRADLDRFRALCEQYGHSGFAKGIAVVGGDQQRANDRKADRKADE
jgi:hypothetical protein